MSFQSTCKININLGNGKIGHCYSLPALEQLGVGKISRLPVSLHIVLESLLRNSGGDLVTDEQMRELAAWQPNATRTRKFRSSSGAWF